MSAWPERRSPWSTYRRGWGAAYRTLVPYAVKCSKRVACVGVSPSRRGGALNLDADTGGDNVPCKAVAGSQLQLKAAFGLFQSQARDHVLAAEVCELKVGYAGEHE